MMITKRVLRHSWMSCVLAMAACGGGQRSSSTMAYAPATSAIAGEAYSPSPIAATPQERPGLGTTWGEQVSAPVNYAAFQRANPSPWAEVLLHYNDADGVNAHAAYVGSQPQPLEVRAGDGSLSVALVDDMGRTLPGYMASGRAA